MSIQLKQYVLSLMHDEKSGFLSGIVKFLLFFISVIYGFLVKCHNFFYTVKILKSYKIPNAAVVSIGNITLGGTGKTPFAITLARRLSRMAKTAVIIRGYGEDEWRMLENRLKRADVGVFVGRDRVGLARAAAAEGVRVLILDDGFQHRRLHRDLDIVLVDSGRPFGNGHLFPRGILREPFRNLKRADIIILTKIDTEKNTAALEGRLKGVLPGVPVIKALHRPKEFFELYSGRKIALPAVAGRRVCVFSGIADPGYFRKTVEGIGARVELEFAFPDHYVYRKKDLERIFNTCRAESIDFVITTEKDAAKLKEDRLDSGLPLLSLSVEFEIVEGNEALDSYIQRRILNH